MSEPLNVRVRWTATRFPRGWSDEQRQIALRALLRKWLDGEPLPAGFAAVIEWRNPENKIARHADWKDTEISQDGDDSEIEAARTTLNRSGWLHRAAGGMSWPETSRRRGRRRRMEDEE